MAEAAVPESELWIVNISAGQTRTMTLDEVDDAFNSGLINEGTMVCEMGTDLWQPLYVVAGLEPPRPTTPGSPAPPSAPLLAPGLVSSPAPLAPRVNPTPIVATPAATPDFLAPRAGFRASDSPPAGAPSPPGAAQNVPRPGTGSPSRLPSAKTPPLPADYMSHARNSGSAKAGAAAPAKGASIDAKARTAAPPTTAPKASLKATLPGTALPFAVSDAAPRTSATATPAAPKMTSTLQGPFPVLAPPTAPAPVALMAPAAAAEPPPSLRSKAPPLPPNAFSHLAAEALAEVGSAGMSASASFPSPAMTSGPPPLPANAFAPAAAMVPQFAPAVGHVPMGAAWTENVEAAVHPQPAPMFAANAQAFAAPALSTFELPQPTGRSRAEVWTIVLAASLGTLIILHRNSVLHGIASALGTKAGYESFEKAVFGEPSLDTPRGVQRLLQRTEKVREKSAATSDHP